MLAILLVSIMVGDNESAWRWREAWTAEMEQAWQMSRQQMTWPEEVGEPSEVGDG